MSASHRRAERAGRARSMEATRLVAVLGRPADADQHFAACDEGREQRPARQPALLRQRERGRQYRCAWMGAGAGPYRTIELERMRQRAVRQRSVRSHDRPFAIAEDMAAAALAHAARIGNDDGAPWQAAAEHDGGNRVGDRVLRSLNDWRGYILKAQL